MISADDAEHFLLAIKEKQWWQGSLIAANALPIAEGSVHDVDHICNDHVSWWVVCSQACNIYNSNFQNVSVIEVVAAREISELNPAYTKGDNPRILHLQATSKTSTLLLEIDIQKRRWLPRQLLAKITAPTFHVSDLQLNTVANSFKDKWLDHFAGWLARSYTRVALPDEFNEALKQSRIREVLDKMLKIHKDDLYGVYFDINGDAETEWNGRLGEMPPPYLLDIMLVVHETADAEKIKDTLIKGIFTDQIQDPDNKTPICRGHLAQRYGIRIIRQSIDARSVTEITLAELRVLVRYSLVDHLSDSTMAAGSANQPH